MNLEVGDPGLRKVSSEETGEGNWGGLANLSDHTLS